MTNDNDTTTSAAKGASASLDASNGEASRVINGREHRKVAAYVTASGKSIPAHWRPVRSCRSYAAIGVAKPSASDLQRLANNGIATYQGKPIVPWWEGDLNKYHSPQPSAALESVTRAEQSGDAAQIASVARNVSHNVLGVAQVDAALIPNVPEYYAQNGEVDLMQKAIDAELNVILAGPTGCGKTHLTERICMNAKREMFTIQGGAGATYERIIAQKDLVSDGNGATLTKLTKGILPIAMERGAVLYLDEPNAIPSDVLFYLFSAMDYRRVITLESGEVVKAARGFVVVGAMNEGAGYAGTALLNAAFRQRAVVIDMAYLPSKREVVVLTTRTSIDKATAKKLVDTAQHLRSGAIKTPIGTRALLSCATLHCAGVKIHAAIEAAITNQIPAQFANERKAVSDVVASFFGLEAK